MASKFFFNGQLYQTPGTSSAVNDSGFAPNTLGIGNKVAFIGTSTGGQPNVALRFSNPQDAVTALISGDLLTAVNKAFSPSAEVGGPSEIIAMVVGQATTSTLTLNSGGAADVVLTSEQYGLIANQTKIKVEAASTPGTNGRKVSVGLGSQLYVQDNLYRAAFTVSYAGVAASATIQVADTTIALSAPAGTVVATINMATFTTVDQVVDQINGVPGFAAALGLNASGTPSLSALDYSGAASDCKTASFTVTATTQAVIDWLNSPACPLISAVGMAGHGAVPDLIGWTFLAGATAPAPIVGDFTNTLAALQGVDCQWIGVLSANPAVWAAADAHCHYMSTIGRKERRCLVGPAVGASLESVEAMPLGINSDRTALCYPGYQDYDQNGNLVTLPSYQTAALVAAAFAGASPGDAMTNKTVNVVGLEVQLRNPTDTDALIQSGVLCLEATDEGYKVVRSISTWLTDNKFDRVELSCGAAVDYMMRSVRVAIDTVRGGRQGPQLLGLAIDTTQSILEQLAKPQPNGPGILVGDANSPPWQNITASIVGDQLLVSWQASPVIPNNFIGVTATLVAYAGTASA